jgi:hypothetical protein
MVPRLSLFGSAGRVDLSARGFKELPWYGKMRSMAKGRTRNAGAIRGRVVAFAALAAVACLGAGQPALASPRVGDDFIPLTKGSAVDTVNADLSAAQVETIRNAVFAVRPTIGLGVAPACTGTAISETLLLTAGHCHTVGGIKAYQKHLSPRPPVVDLTLVHRVLDKRTRADFALYARTSGKFVHYLPVDTGFDFTKAEPSDRFGFPAFTYEMWSVFTWSQEKLLFSPVSRSRDRGREVRFKLESCGGGPSGKPVDSGTVADRAGDVETGPGGPPWCRVLFRAVFYDGDSGAPMLRIHRENGVETMSVVAVGTVGTTPTAPDGSLGSVAAPASLLRDVLPKVQSSRR